MARISRDHLHMWFEHNVNIDTKTLYLGYGGDDSDCDVDEHLAANVLKGLHVLSKLRPDDPINIIMNCTGGDVHHGLAIYDTIRSLPSPVSITVAGHCLSMAAWILQSADTRRMTENSYMMIHHGEGKKTAFDREVDKRCTDILLKKIRMKHPEFTESKLDKLLLKDTNLWPEQALELGLIDEIVEST